jgi:hypothetical protein
MDIGKRQKLLIFAECLFGIYQRVSVENDNTEDTIKDAIEYLRPMMSREDVRKFFINSADRVKQGNKELLINLLDSDSFNNILNSIGEEFSRLDRELIVDEVNERIYEARIKNVDNIMEKVWKI